MLEWAWAEERLTRSHDFWLATGGPDGRPHVMPVWGVWRDDALWFSSALSSRKARNLATNPMCAATTDDPQQPVVLEGAAELVGALDAIARFAEAVNAKYDAHYPASFYDPAVNGTWRLEPSWAFGLDEADFPGSPTRWVFAR